MHSPATSQMIYSISLLSQTA